MNNDQITRQSKALMLLLDGIVHSITLHMPRMSRVARMLIAINAAIEDDFVLALYEHIHAFMKKRKDDMDTSVAIKDWTVTSAAGFHERQARAVQVEAILSVGEELSQREDKLQAMQDLLMLIDIPLSGDMVFQFSDVEIEEVTTWAAAVHVKASDNPDVVIPPRPKCLPADLFNDEG